MKWLMFLILTLVLVACASDDPATDAAPADATAEEVIGGDGTAPDVAVDDAVIGGDGTTTPDVTPDAEVPEDAVPDAPPND